jgi:hypothetical protein
MEEQRIKNMEEELKLLKNQIKAVLMDIKEQLATGGGGGGHTSAPPPWAGVGVGFEGSRPGSTTIIAPSAPELSNESEPELEETDLKSLLTRRAAHAGGKKERAEEASVAVGDERVDLLTISVLSQWLSRASVTISKGQINKLVEIYDITGNLPPRLKQAILLLADLYGDGNHAEDDEDIPASVSLQLLIELDSLLRYRTGALESVVLSMLLDKGVNNRKAS